jgi:hypothetical protein
MTNLAKNDNFRDAVDKMVYWSKLFGVVAYIIGGFMVIAGFGGMLYGLGNDLFYVLGIALFYIIAAPLYLYPGKLLLNFSKITRQALDNNDNEKFAEGFIPMGLQFKFLGVLTVISLVLSGLMLIGTVWFYPSNDVSESVGIDETFLPTSTLPVIAAPDSAWELSAPVEVSGSEEGE